MLKFQLFLICMLLLLSACQVKESKGTGSDFVISHRPANNVWTVLLPANGWYKIGDNLNITLRFPLPVTVIGTPELSANIGGLTKTFNFISGSGTTDLLFRYTVVTSDLDTDGIALTASVALGGGESLTHTNNGVSANCISTFTVPAGTIRVDGVVPILTSVTPPAGGFYLTGSGVPYMLGFSEPVYATGSPGIPLGFGSATVPATYLSGTGTTSHIFRRMVLLSDFDPDGFATQNVFDFSNGNLADVAGNQLAATFPITNSATALINVSGPYITSVVPPAPATFTQGQSMNFTVNFNEAVTVGGTPKLNFTLTTGAVTADCNAGSGTSALTCTHVVLAGEEDLNGIVVSSPINLNGGSIVSVATGFTAALGFTTPSGSGRNVDAKDPVVISVTKPADGTYGAGQTLNFNLVWSEPVTANIGTPSIPVNIGSTVRNFVLTAGNGTANHTYSYTIVSGEIDANGISMGGTIALNGATLVDGVSRSAVLTYTAPVTTGILVDAVNPIILSVNPPAPGTYKVGQPLNFTVTFSKSVTITNTPRIALTIGSSTVYATYQTAAASTAAVFRYTVQSGDLDSDGVVLAAIVDLNTTGTIKDSSTNNAVLTFTSPVTTAVLVDGVIPTLTSVSPPIDATYNSTEKLEFILNFSENVTYAGGAPYVSLTIGSTTLNATYDSGNGSNAIKFAYTVQAGDLDTDGITHASPVVVSGATFADGAGNAVPSLVFTPASTPNVKVGIVTPQIISVTPPVSKTYLATETVSFDVLFNKVITVNTFAGSAIPRIAVDVGGTTKYASYVSGSGSSTLIFTYTVANPDYDMNGVVLTSPVDLNGGTIRDSINVNATLTFTLPNTSGIKVDATLPTLLSVTGPAPGTYDIGDNLDFVATFNKPVDQTNSPEIPLNIGGVTKYAEYSSGSGTSVLTFRYTVQNGDSDIDGIASSSPITLTGGATIQDALLNNSTLTFTLPDTSLVIVDGVLPAIQTVAKPTDGTYKQGDILTFQVTFNKAVTVDTTGGIPSIAITINTGGPTVYATYDATGSTTTVKNFRYTVGSGHADTNGIDLSSPLGLNLGTIKDSLNNNSALTFTPPTTTAVLVDGIAPTFASFTLPAVKTYKIGETMDFTVNWSENMAVVITGGTPNISLTINTGGPTVYADYLSTTNNQTVFRYTVLAGHADPDGVVMASSITLAGGTIKDTAGNNAVLTVTPPSLTTRLVDGIAPTILSIGIPGAATTTETNPISFTVNWTESVTVSNTSRIALNVGGVTKYANYVSGSPGTAIVYTYTVGTGDEDLDGLVMVSPLELPSGTIRDAALNDATDLSFTPPVTTAVKVDGKAPAILSVTPPTAGARKPGQNIDFTLNFSETVIVNTAGGNPTINVTVDSTTRTASYVTGSGSAALLFRLIVEASNVDLDLNGISIGTAINTLPASTTIQDGVSHNAALTFTSPGTTNVTVIYSNTFVWYDFNDVTNVTTATCAAQQCVTGVTDKSGAGNHITSGTNPGPVHAGSGYGTQNSGYIQFNDASSLNLPTLTNMKYYSFVLSTDTATTQANIIGGATNTFYFNRAAGANREIFSTNTAFRMNTFAITAAATSHSTPEYTTNTNYLMWMNISTAGTATAKTFGSSTFNGRIAAFMAFDSSSTLTDTQLDKVRDQLNGIHGAY